ncbi:hypothetical protein RS130_20680 [Paraglaciecola aquimarina]|uniref:PEP-CTERM protein-sorting domain-containing protein n=1 Tax=Paraglaciecola aquimarina TaxID=1235557 RepID=A0ABU3T134_9ALTE|nr:hypothetical protein [Paraglaciecola aquimarina]MDU0355984.1 hypothetical protein [Paraglaciecola aquimarina]
MKKLVTLLSLGLILGFTSAANASLITSTDYSSVVTAPPANWTAVDTERLVDGVTATSGTGRFVGRINSGSALTSTDSYLISLNLASLFDISKVTLFNDYGVQMTHSVSTLTLSALDAFGAELYSADLTGLATGFTPSELFSGSIAGVSTLNFNITSTNADSSFEIREIQVEGKASMPSAVAVSAPSALGLLGLAALVLFRIRRK